MSSWSTQRAADWRWRGVLLQQVGLELRLVRLVRKQPRRKQLSLVRLVQARNAQASSSRQRSSRRPPARNLGLGQRLLYRPELRFGRCRHGSSNGALAWPPGPCCLSSRVSTLIIVNVCIGVLIAAGRPTIRRRQHMNCWGRRGTYTIASLKRRGFGRLAGFGLELGWPCA